MREYAFNAASHDLVIKVWDFTYHKSPFLILAIGTFTLLILRAFPGMPSVIRNSHLVWPNYLVLVVWALSHRSYAERKFARKHLWLFQALTLSVFLLTALYARI